VASNRFVTNRHRNRHIISDGPPLGIFHGRAIASVVASNMSGVIIPAIGFARTATSNGNSMAMD
jgi:hypothetical protein